MTFGLHACCLTGFCKIPIVTIVTTTVVSIRGRATFGPGSGSSLDEGFTRFGFLCHVLKHEILSVGAGVRVRNRVGVRLR